MAEKGAGGMTNVRDINQTARRVTIQQQIAQMVPWARRNDDHLDEFVSQVMVLASVPDEPTTRAVLLGLAAECQAWLEQIDEEAAR